MSDLENYKKIKEKLLVHLADKKSIESFFISASETQNQMRTQYESMGSNVTRFIDWLDRKIDELSAGSKPGSAVFLTLR